MNLSRFPDSYFYASIRLFMISLGVLLLSVISIYVFEDFFDQSSVSRYDVYIVWSMFIFVSGGAFGSSIFGLVSLIKEKRFNSILIVIASTIVGLFPVVVGPAIVWL